MAHWEFNFDSDKIVYDQGPYSLHGIPFNSPLGLSSGSDNFNFSRYFYGANSLISFGPTKASSIDLNQVSDFEFSTSLTINKFISFSKIFDNGQLAFGLLDGHFFLFLKTFYGQAGFISNSDVALHVVHNLKISFDSGLLCLQDQLKNLGCTYTGLNFVDAAAGGATILVGENFIGSIDSIRIESFSKFDVTGPLISIVSPDLSNSQTSLNELNVFLSDNLSGVDVDSVKVYFNGEELSELEISSSSVRGSLPIDSMLEVNELIVSASDMAGNQHEVELLIEPLNLNKNSHGELEVEAKLLSLSKKQSCFSTHFNDVRCFNSKSDKLEIVHVGENLVLRDVTNLQVSDTIACAQDLNGEMYCWRDGDQYQAQRLMGLPSKVLSFSMGKTHGCAFLETNEVWCFDQNLNPFLLHNQKKLIDLNLAKFSSTVCSVFSDGVIKCHDLSINSNKEILSFQYTAPKKLVETFSAQCLLDDNFKTTCFSRKDGSRYQTFESLSVLELKGNYDTLCALDVDHELYCLNEQKNSYSKIYFSSKVLYFDIGKDFSCGILVNGETECFGNRTKLPHVI